MPKQANRYQRPNRTWNKRPVKVDYAVRNYQEVGDLMGITAAGVRHIEAQAFHKLRFRLKEIIREHDKM